MLVVVTVQRVLSVTWPHRVGVLCNTRTAFTVVLMIVGASSVLHTHILYGMDLRAENEEEEEKMGVVVAVHKDHDDLLDLRSEYM
jgi:hypothetical protein